MTKRYKYLNVRKNVIVGASRDSRFLQSNRDTIVNVKNVFRVKR